MKLTRLESLYKSMRSQEIDRYKFDFVFAKKKVDIIYFIDEIPHKLAIGVTSHNYYFEIDVQKGFKIKPFLDDYSEFCKVMDIKYNENAQFSPGIFFKALNRSVPELAVEENGPQPHEVARFRRDVEDSKKIYFVGWLDNKVRNNKASEENLKKTRTLLSEKAYEMCQEKNISSRWSDKHSDAKEYKIKDLEKLINSKKK